MPAEGRGASRVRSALDSTDHAKAIDRETRTQPIDLCPRFDEPAVIVIVRADLERRSELGAKADP
jgi:hypothetical protein